MGGLIQQAQRKTTGKGQRRKAQVPEPPSRGSLIPMPPPLCPGLLLLGPEGWDGGGGAAGRLGRFLPRNKPLAT